MQRHRRHLDEQAEEDQGCDGDLGPGREAAAGGQGVHRVAAGEDAEGDKASEHHRRAEEGVDEELDRRRPAVLVPPDADQQVHRDQRDLEEDVEQDQILRGEHPEHPDLGEEDRREVLLEVTPHVPRREHRDDGQQRRQEEHPETEPVEADPVADVQRRYPGKVLRERGRAEVVAVGEVDVGHQE